MAWFYTSVPIADLTWGGEGQISLKNKSLKYWVWMNGNELMSLPFTIKESNEQGMAQWWKTRNSNMGVGKELSTSQTEEIVLIAILQLIFFNASFRMTIIHFICTTDIYWALTGLPWLLSIKKPPANAGDIRDMGLIPGSGRSPWGGHGNPLQYSCLENPVAKEPGGLQSMGSQRVGHKVT